MNSLRCWLAALLGLTLPCLADPKAEIRLPAAPDPIASAREGSKLAFELRSQQPSESVTNTGVVTIKSATGEQVMPVRFSVVAGSSNWTSLYETCPTNGSTASTLKVLHALERPNQYWFRPADPNAAPALQQLDDSGLMAPFADSDFWIADLGLEFLHWPGQRLLRKELKRGQSCSVLESSRPVTAAGYCKVVSWVDNDTGGIVLAEAYDAQHRRLKEFAPKELRKVHGQWELEGMEIRNLQHGSRTRIQFNLEAK